MKAGGRQGGMPFAYPFVGNRGLLEEARARGPTGVPWLSANQVLLPVVAGLVEAGATFVVSLDGVVLVVKERWFVCPFCDADLPREWNVSARRPVDVA